MKQVKKTRASMMVSHIFIYILAIVVVVMILLYGYKAIHKVKMDMELISSLQFEKDLQGAVDEIKGEYGSVILFNKNNQLKVPGSYDFVCFKGKQAHKAAAGVNPGIAELGGMVKGVDITKNKACKTDSECCSKLPLVEDNIDTQAQENVFLVKDCDMKDSLYIEGIEVPDPYFICTKIVYGWIDGLKLEGAGSSVKLFNISSAK